MTRAALSERIETERLILRVRTVADVVDIFDYASRPEVSYPAGFPPVKTLEDEIYYLEHILPERNQKDNLPDYKRSCKSLYCVQNSGPDTPK